MGKLQESKGMFWVINPKLKIKKKAWKKGQELILSFGQDRNIVIIEV